jgi:hypothetical protein
VNETLWKEGDLASVNVVDYCATAVTVLLYKGRAQLAAGDDVELKLYGSICNQTYF